MKYLVFFIVTYLFCGYCAAAQPDLLKLRQLYYKAPSNKTETAAFEKYLNSPVSVKQSLLEGYRGVCFMINAQHSWNPYDKLAFFNKGKALLDEAIKSDSTEMELRFIRFGVQKNVPDLLGYNKDLASDKKVILDNYHKSGDADLKKRIKTYLEEIKCLTSAELALLK